MKRIEMLTDKMFFTQVSTSSVGSVVTLYAILKVIFQFLTLTYLKVENLDVVKNKTIKINFPFHSSTISRFMD